MKIWLSDLTYTQQTIASDVVPAAVGMIAEYITENSAYKSDVRIFKYPEDLARAFDVDKPDVIGFSNYIWNGSLSLAFAKRIKQVFPDLVIVMGGPNFPTEVAGQQAFLQENQSIDYYVIKEGEIGFLGLLDALVKGDPQQGLLVGEIPNLYYLDNDGQLVSPQELVRSTDLSRIPSPYVSGRLDEFLDGRLMPIIQTNRGCPFTCTFCTEGQGYWNKVRAKTVEFVGNELLYVAKKMNKLPPEKRRHDLYIADSNFGMFSQDVPISKEIVKVQETYDYPKYIGATTGKNKQSRVLEIAEILHGALRLAGSVQSLDEQVQRNIKRSNINSDQIVEFALKADELGSNSYSEVILGLPGDNIKAHFETLAQLVESGFNVINMYQLMILPGTELALETTKKEYEMIFRYRILPRSFGSYRLLGEQVTVAEIEEICVQNKTLPYKDYLRCRYMHLIVNVFFNDGMFKEIVELLRYAGLSRWGWLQQIYENSYSTGFSELCKLFIDETEGELWKSNSELIAYTSDSATIRRYIDGELGSNLVQKYKALSMTTYFPALCVTARQSIRDYLVKVAPDNKELFEIMDDTIEYKRLQIEGLFDGQSYSRTASFCYDVVAIENLSESILLEDIRFKTPQEYLFEHTVEQKEMISSYRSIFGDDISGLSRILTRVHLKKLFRKVQPKDQRKTQTICK